MARIQDQALILGMHPYAESDIILHAFTREHGVVHGLMKGARSRRARNAIDIGMLGQISLNARLPEHLGSARFESELNYGSLWLHDAMRLNMLASITALIRCSFGLHDPHPALFDDLLEMLAQLRTQPQRATQALYYIRFECRLLEEAGFGLSLDQCAATGGRDNLVYVSPKTGRAVSADAGAPYAEKLLPLPPFLRQHHVQNVSEHSDHTGALNVDSVNVDDLSDGLRTTGYFLQHTLKEISGRGMPHARQQLLHLVKAA
jgi:DNA repair protein RecO (recombination protein O)